MKVVEQRAGLVPLDGFKRLAEVAPLLAAKALRMESESDLAWVREILPRLFATSLEGLAWSVKNLKTPSILPSCAQVRGNQIDGHELAIGGRMQFWRTLEGLLDAPSGQIRNSRSPGLNGWIRPQTPQHMLQSRLA